MWRLLLLLPSFFTDYRIIPEIAHCVLKLGLATVSILGSMGRLHHSLLASKPRSSFFPAVTRSITALCVLCAGDFGCAREFGHIPTCSKTSPNAPPRGYLTPAPPFTQCFGGRPVIMYTVPCPTFARRQSHAPTPFQTASHQSPESRHHSGPLPRRD